MGMCKVVGMVCVLKECNIGNVWVDGLFFV